MLSEKDQRKLINANVITRHNAIVISCDEEMQISSLSLFKHFQIKVNDVTIKTIKIQELSSPKGESTYTLSNRYNGENLMFLFKFHLELVMLIDVFKNNGYPENFINNCFKVFLDNKYRIQEKVITVPKKTLFLVLPYLGPLSLQTRTKLRKSQKGILNCCKLQIVFKSQNKLAKAFRFKDRIPKELTSGVVYKF